MDANLDIFDEATNLLSASAPNPLLLNDLAAENQLVAELGSLELQANEALDGWSSDSDLDEDSGIDEPASYGDFLYNDLDAGAEADESSDSEDDSIEKPGAVEHSAENTALDSPVTE